MIIGIDFDGTIVKHRYPLVGDFVPEAIDVMKDILLSDHKIILYTMRAGIELAEAVSYLEGRKIELYGVNENPAPHHWTKSPKIYCNRYIDDAALGCPLIHPHDGGRPWVDWLTVRNLLVAQRIITV